MRLSSQETNCCQTGGAGNCCLSGEENTEEPEQVINFICHILFVHSPSLFIVFCPF